MRAYNEGDLSDECNNLAERAETLIAQPTNQQETVSRAVALVIECVQPSFRSVCELANSGSVPASSQAQFHLLRAISGSPRFSALVCSSGAHYFAVNS